jgi:putative tributyrin esterase
MYVILPDPKPSPEGLVKAVDDHKHPTLYLLHGLSDDHTIWQRRTSIERYVQSLDLAVVMPEVHRSFYTDTATGQRYWTFISEELPALARSYFPLSDLREDNFVAGLSMGGYGAFKLALTHPKRYAAAASLSGAVDICGVFKNEDEPWLAEMRNVFGSPEALQGSRNDLFYLADQLAKKKKRPRLYQYCGTEDFLYSDNLRFREHLKALGIQATYEEGPGTHEWQYWDQQIQRVLAWLPLQH